MKTNFTEDELFADLINLENTTLELFAQKDTSIQEILMDYLRGIESFFPHMRCSIHQIKNGRILNWASPSLPKTFTSAIQNLEIGLNMGSCGTAAFLKEKVIVSDIEHDPRWAKYKELALAHQLYACWSHPIINREGNVIATFAIYYDRVKSPDDFEQKIIDRSVAIIKVLIENRQNSELIKETTLLMEQGQELANFGTWQWDIQNNVVTWSDSLYVIYGLDKASFAATFEGYQQLLHPDDRLYVYQKIQNALLCQKDTTFEERIIRPSGEQRNLRSWGKVQVDKKGNPVKMIGACLDITESKKIEEELLASEARLRNIVDAQTNYVIRTDLQGQYTYYNNKYAEDFGWFFKDESFIGVNCLATVLPHHHERVFEVGTNCVNHPNKVFPVELDNIQKEPGAKSILWHFLCLTDSRGEPSEIQCIGIDVTERKQAEDALRKSNERYEYVNKATDDAIYDWDITSNHIEWGDGFKRLFGYENQPGENYPLEKWSLLIHPADREKTTVSLRTHLSYETQNQWTLDYRFQKADGTYAYVEDNGYILRETSGEAVRMIGVMRDVTKQKREEEHLRLLESVVTHTNDSILIAESDPSDITGLKILYINEALSIATGYTSEELVGQSPSLLIGATSDSTIFNQLVTNVAEQKTLVVESQMNRKNGDKVWINLTTSPVINSAGVLTHWICIAHDVTERLNYIKEIEEQNQKLQEIAWMQSHVVRAPLARLMGFINLIKDYPTSDVEKKELLDHLLSSAHEFDQIIRQISDKTKQI